MIAMPVSLIENWRKEFTKWSEGDFNIFVFHSLTKNQRLDILSQFREEGGVLLTTYVSVSDSLRFTISCHDNAFIMIHTNRERFLHKLNYLWNTLWTRTMSLITSFSMKVTNSKIQTLSSPNVCINFQHPCVDTSFQEHLFKTIFSKCMLS